MLKIRLKERLFILFFALFLALYPPVVKYQEVQAMEWLGMEVSYTTALKFILGLLGVTVAHEVTDDWWEQTWSDCFDYTMEDQTQTTEQINEWWNNVKKGTLDTASSVWTRVKEWIQGNINTSSGGDVGVDITFGNIITSCPLDIGTIRNLSSYQDRIFNSGNTVCCLSKNGTTTNLDIITNCNSIEYVSNSDGSVSIRIGLLTSGADVTTRYYLNNRYIYSSTWSSGAFYNLNISNSDVNYAIFPLDSLFSSFANVSYWNILGSTDGIFDSATDLPISDIGLTTSDTTTTAIPDVIPLPWDNVSDTAEGVSDSIDALQEQVAEGVLSLEEFWERVQEMLGAIAIDTTNDETLPTTQNPDTDEPEKIEDIANENMSNYGFTLAGLEKVFPFCIPWDIYAFVTLLVAEPVAPVINYPFYNPVTNENIIITIDFSTWENVVVVFRYIFDFLLIIGLLLLARSLAGAGGDE